MPSTYPQPLNKIMGEEVSKNVFKVPLAVSSYVSDLSLNRNEIQDINEFISNRFIDGNLNSITIEEITRRTTSVRTEYNSNFDINIKFVSEADESQLLELLNRIQVILYRERKIRFKFPLKSRLSELLLFEDEHFTIDPQIKEEVFFLIQNYISKPKFILNSTERFLDAYRILECYYKRIWQSYCKILDSGINICNKIYDGSASELHKLYLITNLCLGNIDAIISKIKHYQTRESLKDYKSSSGFSVDLIKTTNLKELCKSMTIRWYTLRCSLVHSDPIGWVDRGKYKAIPLFLPNFDDLIFFDQEVQLIEYFSFKIISMNFRNIKSRIKQLFNSGFRIPSSKDFFLNA